MDHVLSTTVLPSAARGKEEGPYADPAPCYHRLNSSVSTAFLGFFSRNATTSRLHPELCCLDITGPLEADAWVVHHDVGVSLVLLGFFSPFTLFAGDDGVRELTNPRLPTSIFCAVPARPPFLFLCRTPTHGTRPSTTVTLRSLSACRPWLPPLGTPRRGSKKRHGTPSGVVTIIE